MFKKKSQGSLEFLLILMFIMGVISLVMYVLGAISVDFSEQKRKDEINNIAESIRAEFDIMDNVIGGYQRKFLIEPYLDDFNFTIENSFLVISDLKNKYGEFEDIDTNKYYYELRNNRTAQIIDLDTDGDGVNESYIMLTKEYEEDFEGIELY